MKLREIAHSRTGDKGDISNISVIPYNEADYEFLKEVLTEEDKKQHAELLHKIRSKYEQALQFVTDLHSPQFTLFINLFREALDNNKYTKQWCPMYLEISDDLTTELYAKLYELDQITAEFNKKLIHQVLHNRLLEQIIISDSRYLNLL